MKVVFLDIDGVLNSVDYMNSLHYNYKSLVFKGIEQYPMPLFKSKDEYGQYFDQRCVNHLESILNFTKAKIVISSTWRLKGLQPMKNMWEYRCMDGEIVGVTPHLNMDRGIEIDEYLREHDYIERYVILDDNIKDISPYHPENFVHINGKFGISLDNAKKAVDILNI